MRVNPINEITKLIQIGLLCVQENAANRPTMSSILVWFCSETITIPLPKAPAFARIQSQSENGTMSMSNVFTELSSRWVINRNIVSINHTIFFILFWKFFEHKTKLVLHLNTSWLDLYIMLQNISFSFKFLSFAANFYYDVVHFRITNYLFIVTIQKLII